MNNKKQHCPKCGSPEAWPPIDGHHNYECNSFMTKEGGFSQDSRCAWLAKITVPLHEKIARLEALERSRIAEVERELNVLKLAHEIQREAYDALLAEKERLLSEQMTEEKALEILDGFRRRWVDGWGIDNGKACFSEEVDFTADELRAIAWWMENKKEVQG